MSLPKRTLAIVVTAALLALTAAAAPRNDPPNNWQVIKRAVRDDSPRSTGREDVRYLKILITSGRSHRDELRLTLPLSLVEAVVRLTNSRAHIGDGDLDEIDFREVLAELKKAGPMALLEIKDHSDTIKIWIE